MRTASGVEVVVADPSRTDHLFPPFEVPDILRKTATGEGWPQDLVQRMVNLRMSPERIEETLRKNPLEDVHRWIADDERLSEGTLRARVAGLGDDDRFADLWANSPERIGDWEVIVRRDVLPFAQWQLHENFSIRLLEDRGLLLACGVISYLNTWVAGRRMALRCVTGYRTRREFRGSGYSKLLGNDAATAHWSEAQFWYIRGGNEAASRWMASISPGFRTESGEAAPEVRNDPNRGFVAEVLQLACHPFDGDPSHFRQATPADVDACVALINRTHGGLDLFRPYTREYLHDKLCEWTWGGKPEWWTRVYSWDDLWLLEQDGRVVACAGLWDRGRFIREIWRHTSDDRTTEFAPAAMLDFGYAEGRDDAMARLITFLCGRGREAGRELVLAPLQQLPAVAERLAHLDPIPEERGMGWNVFKPGGGYMYPPDPPLRRPYVDLAYW